MMGATTLISLLEGGTIDEYGDDADVYTVVKADIPASIIEQQQDNRRRADNEPRTVRHYAGRVPAGTLIRDDMRILDQRTNLVYMLDKYVANTNPFGTPDIQLDLTRNT